MADATPYGEIDALGDCCDRSHALGYDHCPICQGSATLTLPPATPQALLLDLEDQMRHQRESTTPVAPWQLDVWITLVNQARRRM
jgi:hypothetical protein